MSAPHSGPDYASGSPFRAPPPRKRPAWRTWLWIILAILAALLLAYLLTPHPTKGAGGAGGPGGGRGGGGGAGGRPTTVVGVANVVKGDIPIELDALGAVTPLATVTVQPRIAGNIVRIDFSEGQMVKAGQLLVEIDDRPYKIAVQQADGQLLHDQAALEDAQLDLKRYTTLNAQDSIAKQQVDTQAALVKQDRGVVETDQAALANAKLNVEYCHVTAPVSGKVGLRQVDVGNYVTSALTTGLVVITQIDPIDVEFTLPEDSVPQVAARMATGAQLPATALDRSGAQTLAQGMLSTLDNQIDSSTGTVKAKARFANGAGALFPQQFVNIKLLVDTVRDALVVPSQAVRHGSQGDYVYTVDLDQNAKLTPVKVGPIDGERTSILSGVQLGDEVITDGGDRLHDGSAVILPTDAAAMQNAPPPAKKPGFFGWIAGLFGHKPAGGAASGGGSGPAAPGAPASGGGGQASSGGGEGGGQGGGQGGGHGGHGGGAHLQQMLAGLDLTPDQTAKVRAIVTDLHAKAAAAGDDFNARRAIMQAGNAQIEAVLTPDQKAKFEQERAAMRAAGGWSGGGGSSAPPSGGTLAAATADSSAPASASSAPAHPAWGGGGSGGGGGGGGRMAGLIAQLDLDPDQQAKQQAIFAAARAKAEGSDDPDARRTAMHEAMSQFEAILRPDQKAKLEQLRAQMGGPGGSQGGSGGGGAQ